MSPSSGEWSGDSPVAAPGWAGRKTGRPYSTAAMVSSDDPHTHEAVICSAWGKDADWIRDIQARPALRVRVGRE